MTAFDDAEEFGKRARAARGYTGLGKPKFAELMGYTGSSSVTRWESGDLGKRRNSPEDRRSFALELVRRTGAPLGLFDLQEEGASTQVETLALEVRDLREKVEIILSSHGEMSEAMGEAMEELEADEETVARQYGSSETRSEEQGRGAATE